MCSGIPSGGIPPMAWGTERQPDHRGVRLEWRSARGTGRWRMELAAGGWNWLPGVGVQRKRQMALQAARLRLVAAVLISSAAKSSVQH